MITNVHQGMPNIICIAPCPSFYHYIYEQGLLKMPGVTALRIKVCKMHDYPVGKGVWCTHPVSLWQALCSRCSGGYREKQSSAKSRLPDRSVLLDCPMLIYRDAQAQDA